MAPVDTAATIERRATPSAAPSGAIKIDMKKVDRKPAPKTRRYWHGVMRDAPFDVTSRGGIAFSKFSRRTPINEEGKLDEANIPHDLGMVSELTDDQIDVIKKRVANIVIRCSREGGKTHLRTKLCLDDPKGYRPMPGDSPLGYWLYLIPIADSMPIGWRSSAPERMCDEKEMTV